jgi:hypothetical protein
LWRTSALLAHEQVGDHGKLVPHPPFVLTLVLMWPPADPALHAAAVLFAAMPMPSIFSVLAQRHGHERLCAAALLAATLASVVSITGLIATIPSSWQGAKDLPRTARATVSAHPRYAEG